MILIQARAGGRPRTKGSMHPICRRNRTHDIWMKEEVEGSSRWRGRVAAALRVAQSERYGRALRHDGPVEVRLVFHFPHEPGLGQPEGALWPTHITVGDADKLARNVLDALSVPKKKDHVPLCSALILDDSQVVQLSVAKFWSTVTSGEPGVDILVMSAENPERHWRGESRVWRTVMEARGD